jgi:eukaryotic-like serine/threonine-protein kinase
LSHNAPVRAVAFGDDGKTLFTGSENQVQRWSFSSGERLGEPWKFDQEVQDLDLASTGLTLLVHCTDQASQTLQLVGLPSGDPRSRPLRLPGADLVLSAAPDKQSILVGHPHGLPSFVAQLWSLPSGDMLGEALKHEAQIMAAEFSRDGRYLMTAGRDQQVRIWSANGTSVNRSLQHSGIVNTVSISQDGSTILSGSDDKTARLWSTETGLPLGPPLQHPNQVSKVLLSPDNEIAISICSDGSAFLWDVRSSKRIARPMQYEAAVKGCQFNRDGTEILFQCSDGTVRLYDVPKLLPDEPGFIQAWARVQSGFQLDDRLEPRQLLQAEWLTAQDQLREAEGIPSTPNR